LITLSVVFYALSIWVPNARLVYAVATESGSLAAAAAILGPYFVSSLVDIDLQTAWYPLLFALLLSLSSTLTLFFIRMNRALPSKMQYAGSLGAALAGMLGLGCAACGSILAWSLAANAGGIGIVTLLPYRGAEIGYLGLGLLALSAFNLARAIDKPPVCPV
jgi:hypothetical protein